MLRRATVQGMATRWQAPRLDAVLFHQIDCPTQSRRASARLINCPNRGYDAVMETIVRTVGDLDQSVRSALEQVVGHALGERQRLVIQVMALESPAAPAPPAEPLAQLPEWTDVYQGLSDAEIDDLDAAIRERANLSRPTNGLA
jgi:hypothetical protein